MLYRTQFCGLNFCLLVFEISDIVYYLLWFKTGPELFRRCFLFISLESFENLSLLVFCNGNVFIPFLFGIL